MRLTGKLTAKRVAKLLSKGEPGNYHDGNGLRLEIRSKNSATWVSRYELNGTERWFGIGPVRAFTLAEARERNRKLVRQKLADGIDPLTERHAAQAAERAAAAKSVTFVEAAEAFIASNKSKWRSLRHGEIWASSLKTYVYPIIGQLPVGTIDVPLILKVLEQHIDIEPEGSFWTTRTETASRTRGRIEMVLDWATARQYRSGDNPASWKTIGKVLPARNGNAIVHHAALPYADVSAFIAELAKRDGIAARALAFTIYTAARRGETLGARWSEIDLAKKLWTIPAGRMKANVEHQVPLAPAVLKLLANLPREAGNGFVFIGSRAGGRLAQDAMTKELIALKRSDISVHGFRSTFRDWAAEQTAFSNDVIETTLAHTTGDKSELSYKRTKQLPRRRQLMEQWAIFCSAPAASGDNISSMGGRHGRR